MITPGRSRLFPTVSDCFSFSGTPVGPVDHWFNKNHNIQHFSSRPFCAQVARNDAFWLWNPIYPKNPKTPRPREIQYKTIINHPYFDGLYHPFTVIWGWFTVTLLTSWFFLLFNVDYSWFIYVYMYMSYIHQQSSIYILTRVVNIYIYIYNNNNLY